MPWCATAMSISTPDEQGEDAEQDLGDDRADQRRGLGRRPRAPGLRREPERQRRRPTKASQRWTNWTTIGLSTKLRRTGSQPSAPAGNHSLAHLRPAVEGIAGVEPGDIGAEQELQEEQRTAPRSPSSGIRAGRAPGSRRARAGRAPPRPGRRRSARR